MTKQISSVAQLSHASDNISPLRLGMEFRDPLAEAKNQETIL